jgi:hypothetical protein
MVILGRNFLRREAGQVDHAPEAITSSGKMMPGGGRHHAGIDPAKEHRKMSGDNVRERIGHEGLRKPASLGALWPPIFADRRGICAGEIGDPVCFPGPVIIRKRLAPPGMVTIDLVPLVAHLHRPVIVFVRRVELAAIVGLSTP